MRPLGNRKLRLFCELKLDLFYRVNLTFFRKLIKYLKYFCMKFALFFRSFDSWCMIKYLLENFRCTTQAQKQSPRRNKQFIKMTFFWQPLSSISFPNLQNLPKKILTFTLMLLSTFQRNNSNASDRRRPRCWVHVVHLMDRQSWVFSPSQSISVDYFQICTNRSLKQRAV